MSNYDIKTISSDTYTFTPQASEVNINGVTHGGILYYVCDEVIGRYITAIGRKGAAAEANIHYYRPVKIGTQLTAVVTERKTGKRLGTYLAELRSGDQLMADALFTVAFLDSEK